MKTLQQLKTDKDEAMNKLFGDCGVFWAFGDEQFKEGVAKIGLKEGEKLASVSGGGYVRSTRAKELADSVDRILKDYKEAIASNNLRKEVIAYELYNHEAFYTYDITDTVEALGEGYTTAEVAEVFNEIKDKKYVARS